MRETVNTIQARHAAAQDLRRWASTSPDGIWREALNLRIAYGNLCARAIVEGLDAEYWAHRHSLIDRYISLRGAILRTASKA